MQNEYEFEAADSPAYGDEDALHRPGAAEVSPDNPPWGAWTGIGVWAASVLAIIIFPNLFLLPYIAQQDIDLSKEALIREFADTDRIAVILRVLAILPAHLVTLLIAWAVATKLNKYSFKQTLGWVNNLRWWHYLMITGGLFVLAAGVSQIFPEQDNEMMRILKSSRTALLIVAALATFTAPLVEEVVYRGVLFSALLRRRGVVTAVTITTVLFASVHVLQYWGSPGTILMISILSLGLTLLRYYSKNLLPCIILHTVINGLQSLALVLLSFSEQQPPEQVAAIALKLL